MAKNIIVQIPDELWNRFIKKAMKRYGHYGAIKKSVTEAIEKWLVEDEK